MTTNIQFNVTSTILNRSMPRWQLFWSRQVLLVGVAVLLTVFLTVVTRLFVSSTSSFGETFSFQLLLVTACIATTQMAFALFGSFGALFNVALIPFQLMTAGNIISSEMLAPFYRELISQLGTESWAKDYMDMVIAQKKKGSQLPACSGNCGPFQRIRLIIVNTYYLQITTLNCPLVERFG